MEKLKRIVLLVCVMLVFSFVLFTTESQACTGILTKTQDNNYIYARTMEFASGFMPHNLIAVPRNYKYVGQTPSGQPGLPWQTKYGFVGFNPLGQPYVDDGLNEQGLICGGFFFTGCAQYENVAAVDYPNTISNSELPSWLLGTCASVAEVRAKLPTVHVAGVIQPAVGYCPPLHFLVADKSGDAAVIEYLNGQLNIYDNQTNTLTNNPNYIWQTTNLRNYIGLRPENNPAVTINGNQFAQFGQGSGAVGLPGDFTSPSRFIRASLLANWTFQGKNIEEGIVNAFHIMNHFDIPPGAVRGMEGKTVVFDATQWTCAADMTNDRYYFNTLSDRGIRVIDLKKLDLNATKIKTILDIQKPGKVEDVSGQLK